MLDVSRIISGKLRLELQPADLPSIVREAIETVRPAADAKSIRIVTMVESLDSVVQADAQRLQQVIWNLMSNAVKFTPQNGRIDVRVRQDEGDVVIEVTDSGIGIASDFLPFVFDRFRQADSRFSREHGGLGLGLAIARHIVEMHGGQIDVSSEGTGQRRNVPRAAPNRRNGQRRDDTTIASKDADAAARRDTGAGRRRSGRCAGDAA